MEIVWKKEFRLGIISIIGTYLTNRAIQILPLKFFMTNFFVTPGFTVLDTEDEVLFTPLEAGDKAEKLGLL